MFRKTILSWALPVFGLAALCFAMGAGQARADGGSFSLSGSANIVVGGVPTSPGACGSLAAKGVPPGCYEAVDLTSNCGNQAYSNTCYNNGAFVFSDVDFTPGAGGLTLAAIGSSASGLSTDYNIGAGSCVGGSPRIVVELGTGHYIDANFGINQYGTCYLGWQNTGNMALDAFGARWQLDAGNTYMKWSDAVAAAGGTSTTVTSVFIVLDGGWTTQQGQDLTIDNFNVAGTIMNGANVSPAS